MKSWVVLAAIATMYVGPAMVAGSEELKRAPNGVETFDDVPPPEPPSTWAKPPAKEPPATPVDDIGRFQISAVAGADRAPLVWRVDTRTGEVSLCHMVPYPVPGQHRVVCDFDSAGVTAAR